MNPAGEEAVEAVDRVGDLISAGTNGSGELEARLRFREGISLNKFFEFEPTVAWEQRLQQRPVRFDKFRSAWVKF